jgi:NDP-mannose synthase
VRALILAGGKGSRLRPLTFAIPKPLVPIDDTPILEVLIRQLRRQGFARVTISVGHMADLIRAFCGDGARWGIELDYLQEEEPLGTIGCLSLLSDLAEDRILVVNGDTFTDFDMAAAYREHDPACALTLCASRRAVEIDFGVLETNPQGRLVTYREKPSLSYRVAMGINVISAWAIPEFVPAGAHFDLPDLVRELLAAGREVMVRDGEAFWLDLGRLSDLEAGSEVFRANRERFLPR